MQQNIISIDRRGIRINGEYTVLLCASLFYFRVPEGEWTDRMIKIREAGYNTIDVYFPWNFHEESEGVWDFETGMKNVARFLGLAAEHGLFVVARPGPYICSEWDGGGLPAYLFAQDDVKIRQRSPLYLSYVKGWYRRILSLIKKYQFGTGGTVIMIQIENELDFFDCDDVPGYMEELRDMITDADIEIPQIACAGQIDLYGAWGGIDGVIPTLNLYINPLEEALEERFSPYRSFMQRLNVPLMVSETSRDILLMRRLFASGFKLLGPYNQVAGFDFGFTNSVNNWGTPLSFQTSYYDFDSLISPYGERSPRAVEDRVFALLLTGLGEPFALAESLTVPLTMRMRNTGEARGVSGMALPDGKGIVLSLTNSSEEERAIELLKNGEFAYNTHPVILPGISHTFAFVDMDLTAYNIQARILFSSAEPVVIVGGATPLIIFSHIGCGYIHLAGSDSEIIVAYAEGQEKEEVFSIGREVDLRLFIVPRLKATRFRRITDDAPEWHDADFFDIPERNTVMRIDAKSDGLSYFAVDNQDLLHAKMQAIESTALAMEKNAALRGFGFYRGTFPAKMDRKPAGIIFSGAADILSVYCGDSYLGTYTPGGNPVFVPLQNKDQDYIDVRTEIWGHSNFDDSRNPALRLDSTRGISEGILIYQTEAIPYWHMEKNTREREQLQIPYITHFGRRMTIKRPVSDSYFCELLMPEQMDRCFLSFDGMECEGRVVVDGQETGQVDPFSTTIDLSSSVEPGKPFTLSVELRKRCFKEEAGNPLVYFGVTILQWDFAGSAEQELLAGLDGQVASLAEFPSELSPGDIGWLCFDLPEKLWHGKSVGMQFHGKDVKATVFYGGIVCGRLVLPTDGWPKMAGGDPGLAYLPACWTSGATASIRVLVEAIGSDPSLDGIDIFRIE